MDTQTKRNAHVLEATPGLGQRINSEALRLDLSFKVGDSLPAQAKHVLAAIEVEAARTAAEAVAEISKLNEVDHLGGGLDLIPALAMTLAAVDHERVEFTIEHAHTSIGYYGVLAAYGYLDRSRVISAFRQSLDIAGHVSWVPGGTQLSGGRLGVMIPAAVGQALGLRARQGKDAWVICHCGDAGWISGQALNGFNAAYLHKAPVTFIMHRNGIQLSGTNRQIMNRDPRPIIAAMGIEIIEVKSLHHADDLYHAYARAKALAAEGKPSLIYPTGEEMLLSDFARRHHITPETAAFAGKNNVPLNQKVWVPGALMSYRDVECMLECLFLVNDLPGGKGHHDGHMKGRDLAAVLANPMLQAEPVAVQALAQQRATGTSTVVTTARPSSGSPNLALSPASLAQVKLPGVGVTTSPRAGVQEAYGLLAQQYPQDFFVLDCDLAPSTKVDKARKFLPADHQFELSIEEQIAAIMGNGLAMSTMRPQLVVFATFAAFFEGIAREGFEMWRYQRNLNGVNEGLNVTFHLSHVGACTGRDHFSGWSLDWINLAIGYLPYLHRFYAPADARGAFVATRDLAAHYGAHIIGIPRDNLPVLATLDGKPAWNADSAWEPMTQLRSAPRARRAILALGATAFLATEASDALAKQGVEVDAYAVNGLPLGEQALPALLQRYPEGLVTVEDGLIGPSSGGVRGFAGLVRSQAYGSGVPLAHIGIEDPRIAPSEGHMEVWAHFGITSEAIITAARGMAS
jgi:transketolase N-terminal domain/subunit/transketolase C-terminal domain/subunit